MFSAAVVLPTIQNPLTAATATESGLLDCTILLLEGIRVHTTWPLSGCARGTGCACARPTDERLPQSTFFTSTDFSALHRFVQESLAFAHNVLKRYVKPRSPSWGCAFKNPSLKLKSGNCIFPLMHWSAASNAQNSFKQEQHCIMQHISQIHKVHVLFPSLYQRVEHKSTEHREDQH